MCPSARIATARVPLVPTSIPRTNVSMLTLLVSLPDAASTSTSGCGKDVKLSKAASLTLTRIVQYHGFYIRRRVTLASNSCGPHGSPQVKVFPFALATQPDWYNIGPLSWS